MGKLDDALWAYCTAFKTLIGMTHFWCWKAYCLVELEHKTFCAIKHLNFDLKAAGEKRLLQLNELGEICMDAYENA